MHSEPIYAQAAHAKVAPTVEGDRGLSGRSAGSRKGSLRGLDFAAQEKALAPAAAPVQRQAEPDASGGATAKPADPSAGHALPEDAKATRVDALARASARDMCMEDLGERKKEEQFELWRAGQALAELERTQVRYGADELAQRRKALEARADNARNRLAQTEQDLQLMVDPSASDKAVDAMLARRGKLAQAESVEAPAGLDVKTLGTVSAASGGPTVTTVGDRATKKGATTSTSVDYLGGSVTRARTVEDTVTVAKERTGLEETDPKEAGKAALEDDATHTKGTKTATSTTVGLEGLTRSTATTRIDGKDQATDTTTSGVERGDGKLGAHYGKAQSAEHADGSKSERQGKVKGGLIHGEDGDGGYLGVDAAAKKTTAGGLSGSVKGGADGRYVVLVEAIPDTNPVKYQVKTTIGLSASVGVGGGVDKEADSGVKGGVGVAASAEGAATAVFTHELTEEETKKYLADLKAAESGKAAGAHPELGVLATGFSEGWQAAKDAVDNAGKAFDPHAARNLAEGDGIELGLEGSVGVGVDLSASGGGISAGFGVSGKLTGETKLSVKKKGGKLETTFLIGSGDEYGAKGSAGVGGTSVELGGSASESSKTAITIVLDPQREDFDALFAELKACGSQPELGAFAVRHPEVVTKRVRTDASGTKSSGALKVAGHTLFGAGESADRKEEVTETAAGKSYALTGSNTQSGSLGPVSGSTKESLELTVDEQGQVYGDLSETRTDTNVGKSAQKLAENVAKDPLGVATGGAKSAVDDVHVAGLLLGPADIAQIEADAKSDGAWMQHATRPVHVAGWDACREAIVAAKGDKAKVALALERFVGTEGHDRYEVLYSLVRKPYSGAGGLGYELPEGLAPLKPEYKALIQMDPIASLEGLMADGKDDEAMALVEATIKRLSALDAGLRASQDAFETPAAEAEMHSRIAARRHEVDRAHSRLLAKRAGLPADAYADADDQGLYADLVEVVRGEKKDEQAWFAKLGDLAGGEAEIPLRKATEAKPIVNQLRELYVIYRRDWAALQRIAKAHPDFAKDKPIDGLGPDELRMKIAFDPVKSSLDGLAHFGNPMSDDAREAQQAASERAESSRQARQEADALMKSTPAERAQREGYGEWKAGAKNAAKAGGLLEQRVAAVRGQAQQATGLCNGLSAKGIAIKPEAAPVFSQGYAKYNEAEEYRRAMVQQVGGVTYSDDQLEAMLGRVAADVASRYQATVELFERGRALQGG